MADNIIIEMVQPATVIETVVDKTIIIELIVRGPQGPPGPAGTGALDLPLEIASPQDGDVLTFDPALQTDGAWKNVRRRTITDGGFY